MNNIPEFPQQTELKIEHNEIIKQAAIDQGIQSADYSTYYLASWFYNRPAKISRIGDRIVFDVEGRIGGHIFLGPFGTGPIGSAVDKLLKHAVDDFKEEPVLRFLPKALANEIRQEREPLKIENHRDFYDYLYLKEDLASLSGRKFQKRRNLFNKFQRMHMPEIIPLDEKDTPEILKCMDIWYENYGDDDPFLELESQSVKRVLPILWKLGGVGIRIKVEGVHCGISWAVPISDETWLVPVEKASRDLKGMYQFVNWALANQLPDSVKYLNREADMGIEGLRIAKERYNPVAFEEKQTFWY